MTTLLAFKYDSFLRKPHILSYFLILFMLMASCSKTDACEDANTGTLIIQNSRTTGVLKIFFDNEPVSGNVAGDINIQPGETTNSDQLAGQHTIYAILDTSSCSGGQCIIRNETLPSRTVNLDTCQEFNLIY